MDIDGVPLPDDVVPLTDTCSPFAGTWIGVWGNNLKTILVVEEIRGEGDAQVVYAVADKPGVFAKAWSRLSGTALGRRLTVHGEGFNITYDLSPTGRFRATFADNQGIGVLRRVDLSELQRGKGGIRWTTGESKLVPTRLAEGGRAVHLEVVVQKPDGEGPFPLAVVNHGSTGSGTDASLAKEIWVHGWLTDVLNTRGYLVAFPQRRGRGRSDGLYDEGFSEDRSDGYTSDSIRSMAGFDRALEDLDAAIGALKTRPDVRDGSVLLAGQSRGGILSVGYAGKRPEAVSGVINFAGGWLGDGCDTAVEVNQTLFRRGANYPLQTLWLYGYDDQFYQMPHCEANFAAFQEVGGRGEFIRFTVPGNHAGHDVIWHPPLWSDRVASFVDQLDH